MHFSTSTILALASSVAAHGIFRSPYPRAVGPASLAACGSAVTDLIKADNTSHIEGLPEAAATDPDYDSEACNLWLCKGLQFTDNAAHILSLSPSQVLPLNVYIRIPHAGTANVSIVDTKTNTIIGNPLIYFDRYAESASAPANNSVFSVTIPRNLSGKCLFPGDCVIQWWWFGTAAKQTYESCLDFMITPLGVPPRGRRA